MVVNTSGVMHLPIPEDTDPWALLPQTVRDLAQAIELFVGTLKPMAVISRTTDVSIPPTTETIVPFQSEDVDTLGGVNLGSSTTNIVIPTGFGGLYAIVAKARWTSGNPQTRTVSPRVNSIRVGANEIPQGTNAFQMYHSAPVIMPLADGDIVNMSVWHNDSAAANVGAAATATSLSVFRL